jgi:hypothetical protein
VSGYVYDEPRIARLLNSLPPAPEAWVRAAQELPLARRGLDDLVRRASEDAALRLRVIADLERALRDAGLPARPAVVAALRRRLDEV